MTGYNADGTPNYEHPDWSFVGGIGWINKNDWQGPRTHYEDGTPVPDFSYRRDWNPNWSIRLNDLSRIAGGQHAGSGRTTIRPDENYATLNSPYWRTAAGRQFVSDMAISNKSIQEIYKEMVRLNNFSEEREEAKAEWARLRSGTANDSSADTSGGLLSAYNEARANRGNTEGRTSSTPRASSLFDAYMKERNL